MDANGDDGAPQPPDPPRRRTSKRMRILGESSFSSSQPNASAELCRDDSKTLRVSASGTIFERAKSRGSRQREVLMKYQQETGNESLVPLKKTKAKGRKEGSISQLHVLHSDKEKEEDEQALEAAAGIVPGTFQLLGQFQQKRQQQKLLQRQQSSGEGPKRQRSVGTVKSSNKQSSLLGVAEAATKNQRRQSLPQQRNRNNHSRQDALGKRSSRPGGSLSSLPTSQTLKKRPKKVNCSFSWS